MKPTSISLIIPFSRPDIFRKLLSLIDRIKYEGNYEVLLVLNNVGNWLPPKQNNLVVRIIHCKQIGPSAARNMGILEARYCHQVFTDDDCEFESDLLRKYHLAWAKHTDALILGGRVQVRIGDDRIAIKPKQQSLLKNYDWCFGLVDYGPNAHPCTVAEPIFTANMGIKQSKTHKLLFSRSLGRFLTDNYLLFGEDCLLCYQCLMENKQVWYDPDLVVINSVLPDRFTEQYVMKRVMLAGIERQITDTLLKKYSNWDDYPSQVRFALLQLLQGKISPIQTLIARYGILFFASYHLYQAITFFAQLLKNINR